MIVRSLVLALVLAASAAGPACSESMRGPAAGAPPLGGTTAPGQYIVTLVAGAGPEAITSLYGRFGVKELRDLGQNAFLVILTEDPGLPELEKLAGGDARIKAIQPNFLYHTQKPLNAQ